MTPTFTSIQALPKKYYFFLLWFFTFLLYLPGIDGRFTSDFYNWVNVYDTSNISELWTFFGYPGLHQMYHIPFYIAFKLFFLNKWGWHVLFTLLHSANAFLLFKLSSLLFSKISSNSLLPIICSVLFLISPFQTETVAWGATIHYLLLVFFSLNALIQLLKYFETKHSKHLLLHFVFYFISMFTMELPLVMPGVFILLSLFFRDKMNLSFKNIFAQQLPVYIFLITGYFMLSKLVFGAFIGHYGMENHLNLDPFLLLNTLSAYLLKFTTFYRYLPFEILQKIFIHIFSNVIFQTLLLLFITVFCSLILIKTKASKISLSIVCLVCFAVSLLPVLNIEMSSNMYLQTDRYSYLASIFFFISITSIVDIIKNNLLRNTIFGGYLLVNFVLLNMDIQIWRETGVLAQRMIHSYNFDEEVYTLNLIDNHKGAYLFRNGLDAAIRLERGIDIKEQFNPLISIITKSVNDSVTYKISEDTLKVDAIKWGRWFWRNGRGATNFENEEFKFELGYLGAPYHLMIKNPKKKEFIYLNSGYWKELSY